MIERLDPADGGKSVYSDSLAMGLKFGTKKPKRPKNPDPFYERFDNEEDYLLTHLSEIIAQNKRA